MIAPTKKWNIPIVWLLRVIVGGLFIYSGFVKLIDLWGFIFKIEEYFNVWGWSIPRSVNLIAALLLSSTEFVGGTMLLMGSYKRTSVWCLSALMAGLLPLTAYIFIANPVNDCGCFGDAWKISNGATLLKNILLTAMLIYLCRNNSKVKQQLFLSDVQWIPLVATCWFAIELGLTCYNVQPFIDFRAYPEGTKLLAETDYKPVQFIYSNGDETRIFSSDALPTDSVWQFVERVEDEIEDSDSGQFTIFDGDDDVTEDVINDDGKQFLLVIPELVRADVTYTYFINDLVRLCKKHDIGFDALIASDPESIELWKDFSLADYNCYSADDTQLKELARGNMSLVYLEDGVIKWKRTVSSFAGNDIEKAEQKYNNQFPNHLITDNTSRLIQMVRNYLLFIGIVAAIQWAIIFTRNRASKNRAANSVPKGE